MTTEIPLISPLGNPKGDISSVWCCFCPRASMYSSNKLAVRNNTWLLDSGTGRGKCPISPLMRISSHATGTTQERKLREGLF
ncbi:hypothetical protein OIDMADRAFT_19597 [Oidiodendron maius Zn]|uniref:Uncharacterized protein n=1 Tax=Oidiodendron maius (strain Zn) TaxID=913774 RepID=A0A0C3CNU5_OIDMZ|nr:hypothetical protein OIDMADRAFT_19597 [Oidiodendron maius Zn]